MDPHKERLLKIIGAQTVTLHVQQETIQSLTDQKTFFEGVANRYEMLFAEMKAEGILTDEKVKELNAKVQEKIRSKEAKPDANSGTRPEGR
jgi:hypothetical protein